MNRLMSRMFGILVLAGMLIFATGTAYSQMDSTRSNKMDRNQKPMTQNAKYDQDVANAASILRTKVDLTLEQTRRVEGILQEYKDNSTKMGDNTSSTSMKGNSETMNKIGDVLTADQKTKFDNVKTQWWTDTQKKLSKGSDLKDTHSKSDSTWSK